MSSQRLYDSAQREPPWIEEFVELWRYRDLVVQLVRRDMVARYKRSLLGVAWTMLNPLGMMLVITVAFWQVFGARRAYPVYLLSGLIAWQFFAQTTRTAMRHFVGGAGLMQRIYVPKTVFAVSAVGTGLVNLLVSLVPLVAVMLVMGLPPQASVLFLPVAVLLLAGFTLGVGLLLSTLAAYFVDATELYEVFLHALLYLTPIIYPRDVLPVSVRWLLVTGNPIYHFVRLFRDPLYEGTWPGADSLVIATLWTVTALGLGWAVFARRADEFPYRV